MAENKKDDKDESGEEPKDLTTQIVNTLGLVDLIFGGLTIYLVWLFYDQSNLTKIFKSTGQKWVDLALLACAAAFVGKIVTLASHLMTAIGELLIEKGL